MISVDERYFGKTGTCLKCGQRIVIEPPQSVPHASPRMQQLANVVIHGTKAQPHRKSDEDSVVDHSSPTQIIPAVRPARDVQKKFARDLGIKFDDNITNRELSALIASALTTGREPSPAEMVNQLEKRGVKTLMITWPKAKAADNPAQAVLELISSEGMSMGDIHFALAAVVSQFLAQEELTFPEYSRKYAQRQKNERQNNPLSKLD
jgi:hypothetical protein